MGFFDRLANLWSGFWESFIGDREKNNPALVYEAAIKERVQKHADLKKAVSSIIYLRNKTQKELEDKEALLADIELQIPVAMDEGEDEVAMVLLEQQAELEGQIASLTKKMTDISAQSENAKASLTQFRSEIEKLKREKDEMLAKLETAEARQKIAESLDGLSVDADVQALNNVREAIHKKEAEADISTELQDNSLDNKLKKIQAKTGNARARARLAELKKQRAAMKAKAEAGVKKSI